MFQVTAVIARILQGPDVAASLIEVLCLAGFKKVAVQADKRGVFVNVGAGNKDQLRILLWIGNATDRKQLNT